MFKCELKDWKTVQLFLQKERINDNNKKFCISDQPN